MTSEKAHLTAAGKRRDWHADGYTILSPFLPDSFLHSFHTQSGVQCGLSEVPASPEMVLLVVGILVRCLRRALCLPPSNDPGR